MSFPNSLVCISRGGRWNWLEGQDEPDCQFGASYALMDSDSAVPLFGALRCRVRFYGVVCCVILFLYVTEWYVIPLVSCSRVAFCAIECGVLWSDIVCCGMICYAMSVVQCARNSAPAPGTTLFWYVHGIAFQPLEYHSFGVRGFRFR